MQSVRHTRRRDEQGAYAVLFGLLVTVVFGIAAVVVDLGNAMSRKSDIQGQVDFAALAGGQELTSSSSTTISAAVASAVANSMNRNQPVNGTCVGCVTPEQLTNGTDTDGEIRMTAQGMKVFGPQEQVDYGFAGAIGMGNSIQLQTTATVQIFSPGSGAMPMYAAAGCDYGLQNLTDPASGQVNSTHGNLAHGDDAAAAAIASIADPSPAQIPLTPDVAGPSLTVTGTDFIVPGNGPHPGKHVTQVGFFLNDGATVHSVALDPDRLADAELASIAAVPAAVAGVEAVWWVRVFMVEDGVPGSGEWSSEEGARPLQVGSAQLQCEAGSNDGNFGTLRLPRADVSTGQNLSMNIADGFDDPLSLAIHQGRDSTGRCSNGMSGAIESQEPNRLYAGTNCVATDPGLAANDAASGLVEGVGSSPGRLDAPTVCGSDQTINLHGVHTINGDALECLLDGRATVAAISSPGYNGDAVLSEEIYDSPRFFWVPVLTTDAERGTSERYSIIDFRPAFLTDLHVHGNDIDQVDVIFFNWRALPSRTSGPVASYIGVGPKVLRLVD